MNVVEKLKLRNIKKEFHKINKKSERGRGRERIKRERKKDR